MNWNDMATVGRIARPHGIRGHVIVNPETDFPVERFQPGSELFVDGRTEPRRLVVTSVRFHQERPILGLEGLETMTAAEELAGLELRVPADRLLELPAGTFYRHDLVGCHVETTGGGTVGIVTDVEGTFAGSRLVVSSEAGEVLIPLAAPICATIEPDRKRIVIAPPEGLLDVNR
jgi:16S rRNA processing protein RimM